jgi:hypothetical protein
MDNNATAGEDPPKFGFEEFPQHPDDTRSSLLAALRFLMTPSEPVSDSAFRNETGSHPTTPVTPRPTTQASVTFSSAAPVARYPSHKISRSDSTPRPPAHHDALNDYECRASLASGYSTISDSQSLHSFHSSAHPRATLVTININAMTRLY